VVSDLPKTTLQCMAFLALGLESLDPSQVAHLPWFHMNADNWDGPLPHKVPNRKGSTWTQNSD
jgi:hypothetical protein